MKILRYTEAIQKQIGSKVKAEPWMHIGFTDGHYAIWIWDTRQILGIGTADESKVNGTPAKDNHKPLVGQDSDKFVFEDKHAQQSELSRALTSAIRKAYATFQRHINGLFEDSIIMFMPAELLKNIDAKQLTDAMNRRVVADCKRRHIDSPNFFDVKHVEQAINKYAK